MDKRTLKQYRALKREIVALDNKIDDLYDRGANVPVVAGKVTGSSSDFPYTEVRTTVQMYDPKKQDEINRLLDINEERRDKVERLLLDIEEYIAAIPDSVTRQIFELTYLQGIKQFEVSQTVGYSRSRISQIISDYLKD